MKLATESSAEANFRVTEPPGPKARGSERAGGETRTAGAIPPPCYDSATRAGVSRFTTRVFLFLLVLAAGVSFPAPEASAQNRNTWKSSSQAHQITGVTFPAAFRNTAGEESFTMSATTNLNWFPYRIRVCAKTSTPTGTASSYYSTGCGSELRYRTPARHFSETFTLTSTMVTNGGAVVIITNGSGGPVIFGQWIPTAAPAITLSKSSLAVDEGSSVDYTVRLSVRPLGDVKVRVARGNGAISVNKAGGTAGANQDLTFTKNNWATAQTITIAAVQDDNAVSGDVTISHTTVDADTSNEYDSASKNLTATVTDDDGEMVVSRSGALALTEGNSATYNVKLKGQPASDVVVRVSSADSGAVTVNKSGGTAGASQDLTFTNSNWNTNQAVTLAAAHDNDVSDESVTITHAVVDASSSNEFDGAADVTFDVTVTDDDIPPGVVVSQASGTPLVINEGSSGSYNVKLAAQPTGDVTVVISSDNPDVRVKTGTGTASGSLTLTFTASGANIWSANQAVTVEASTDADSLDESATLTQRIGSGSATEYSSVQVSSVAVSVTDTTSIANLSVSGGGEVAEGDSGTTARASFTVTLSPARRQAVSVSYATSDGTAEAGSDYESATGTVTFAAGETSKTVTVTVNGDDEAEGNETFTLGLTTSANGQIDPQNSSAQAVIMNDDEKMVDAGMPGEFSVGETTVTVDSTLPDDTGLEVVLPSELERGGETIEEITVTLRPTDAKIDAGRFGYTGRDADHVLVDVEVSPVPDGAVRICLPVTGNLRRAAGQQRLYLIRFSGGEWEELSSETEGETVCADVRGFSPFAVVFQIDYAKRRVGDVNRAILPELTRAMTASTLEAITSRIGDAMAGGGATAGAFGAPSEPESEYWRAEPDLRLGEFEDGETLSLTDAVDGSYYSVSLASGHDSSGGEEGLEERGASEPRGGGLGMWMSGDYRGLSGKGGGSADWDGRVISGHLGADYRFGRSFLAGVATSWSQGSFDYTGRGEGSARVRGDYGSRMNSFHPYLGLSLSRRLGLWAAGGWGFGEIRIDDGEITGRQRASTRLGTLATGADLTLLGGDASSLSLKGEAWISRVKVKGNGGRVEGLRVKTNRLRAALEGSHAVGFGSGSSLVPSLEFAIRRDGGDGETGVGGELGGGVALVSSSGLTVEARGRGLLFHQGDAKEWGVGGSVRFDPGGDERGLSMSVIPSWGDSASGVQSLWESEAAEVGSSAAERSLSLETEVGYGFPALGDRGLLTPYGGFGRTGGDGRSYRAGSRLSMGGTFDVSLEGLRTESGAGGPEHGLTLQGRFNW